MASSSSYSKYSEKSHLLDDDVESQLKEDLLNTSSGSDTTAQQQDVSIIGAIANFFLYAIFGFLPLLFSFFSVSATPQQQKQIAIL